MTTLYSPEALSGSCDVLEKDLAEIERQLERQIRALDLVGKSKQAAALEALLFDGVGPCRRLLAALPREALALQPAA